MLIWAKIQREIAAAGITRPPMTVLGHEIFPLVKEAKARGVQLRRTGFAA